MRAADLAGLYAQGDRSPGADYAQGTVVAWNPDTGENTVNVAGTTLDDLPILNTGEAITLREGHVVGLLKWRAQWFILGRITMAGSGQFASASTLPKSDLINYDNLSFGTGAIAEKGRITFTVPTWATTATVRAVASYGIQNGSGSLSNFYGRIRHLFDGEDREHYSASYGQAVAIDYKARVEVTDARTYRVAGSGLIAVLTEARVDSANWPADGNNAMTLSADVTFRSDF